MQSSEPHLRKVLLLMMSKLKLKLLLLLLLLKLLERAGLLQLLRQCQRHHQHHPHCLQQVLHCSV